MRCSRMASATLDVCVWAAMFVNEACTRGRRRQARRWGGAIVSREREHLLGAQVALPHELGPFTPDLYPKGRHHSTTRDRRC